MFEHGCESNCACASEHTSVIVQGSLHVVMCVCMSGSVRESVSGCGCAPAHSAVSVTGSGVDFSRLGKEFSYRLIWHSVLIVMQVAVSWSQRAW